ncbi:penicillin-binding transpeptidase domain-containing protein [Angustibacter aerolatus]
MDGMQGTRRRWPWIVAAALVVVLAAGALAVVLQRRAQTAKEQAAARLVGQVAAALRAGDVSGLPLAGTTGAAAQTARAATVKALARPTVTAGATTVSGDVATAPLVVAYPLGGGAVWRSTLPLRLTHAERWQVAAGQQLVAPDVRAGDVLRVRRDQPDRAEITGAGKQVLVTDREVVDVGIQPRRVTGSVAALAAKVAKLTDVEAAPLAKRVSAASPDAFVDVITLRRDDYDAVRTKLRPLPGVVFRERTQPLAPTREFARALLGSVGPVTAEMVTKGGGRYAAGDVAGVSGLQRQYDEQLAGTPGTVVEAVSEGDPRTLYEVAATTGKPLALTLATDVQEAADRALQDLDQPAALVAVSVQTGAVLAVANSPATGLDRALVGRYPPGSTFKVVTTLSLLGKGLRADDRVECPQTATVDGRTFRNFEAEQFGAVPFRTDFARSCNTAFVGLSPRLDADDLRRTAASTGIGVDYDALGTDAFSGSVPATTSDVDKAAASFGQGRVLVSPLAVAVSTASVARGGYLPPTLVDTGATAPTAKALDDGDVTTLRSLMRSVVTDGTGTALRDVDGGEVRAKTGTAEFGTDDPPRTRAWITGWQGDVAFAVLVEEGASGGTVAGPVAARFLRGL